MGANGQWVTDQVPVAFRAGDGQDGTSLQGREAAMSLTKDFREFLLKQNALALAVGVVIGAAVGKVVSAIVDDIIMPIVGLLIPGGEWRNWELPLTHDAAGKVTNAIKYGDLLGRVVDFLIIAIVVFAVTKALIAAPTPTKPCPRCAETIPLPATRCKFCTSDV
jgi:large conductance mechanosensitive channel